MPRLAPFVALASFLSIALLHAPVASAQDVAVPETEAPAEGSPAMPEKPAPPAEPLPIAAEVVPPEGEAIPLLTDGPTEKIPPESTIRLRSERALTDLRVRLLDEAGKLVPTRDRGSVGEGTRYEIRPVEPLITGSAYRLIVDGQYERFAKDLEGTSYATLELHFRTDGEKPPPPPPPKPKRGRRR